MNEKKKKEDEEVFYARMENERKQESKNVAI